MATSYELRRAAIARSLFELEKLFGRKPPANEIAPLAGKGEVDSELQNHPTPFMPHVQAGGST